MPKTLCISFLVYFFSVPVGEINSWGPLFSQGKEEASSELYETKLPILSNRSSLQEKRHFAFERSRHNTIHNTICHFGGPFDSFFPLHWGQYIWDIHKFMYGAPLRVLLRVISSEFCLATTKIPESLPNYKYVVTGDLESYMTIALTPYF